MQRLRGGRNGDVAHVVGWRSSQNEVGTEPGEVSTARALGPGPGRNWGFVLWALGSHGEG